MPSNVRQMSELDELNDCMQRTYRVCAERERESPSRREEHERRASALQGIDEILQWRPLSSFKAEHLEFLETLFANWRELEIEAGAPEPDEVQ